MPFIADLHIHSKYSRATSPELCFEQLSLWGRRKGIALVGSGDCTHPGWLAEMREKLVPDGDGLLRLKEAPEAPAEVPPGEDVRFLVTGEVSTIYKAGGATRKVHHLICLPGLEEATRFAARLERIGNIASDGRPILGLDSRDLLETLLEVSPRAVLIPAHIWTPWFSVLGSKSGFDSIEECYRDLAPQIFALETGLSSDPAMNWMVSRLDRYTLVSNSDAHSPGKLGREANLFTGEMGYTAIMRALAREAPDNFLGTIEFFPEEGKYHFDGHRKCHFSCAPEESKALNGHCPTCGGALTLGVEYRVLELADRPRGVLPAHAPPFTSLLSLSQILAEVWEASPTSARVQQHYHKLLTEVGPELYVLMRAEHAQLAAAGGELFALAVDRVRAGAVHTTPGYDGEYGTVQVFTDEERADVVGQVQLFAGLSPLPVKRKIKRQPQETPIEPAPAPSVASGLSPEQQRAVQHPPGPLLIVAGPGAGKTRTLVERIAWLVAQQRVLPSTILALTFSNRAAREMAERLAARFVDDGLPDSDQPTVATFHKLGFRIISEHREALGLPASLMILPEEEATALLTASATEGIADLDALERTLATLFTATAGTPDALRATAEQARQVAPSYAARKRERGVLDFTDLLLLPLLLLAEDAIVRTAYQQRWPHIFVDEYQDVNVLQYLLLRLLCPAGSNLCAIGDPDQAIYGFRGADVRYFLRFRQDYPDAGMIALTRNYRSSRTIVRASTQVIDRDSLLGRRELWSDRPGPTQVEMAALPSPAAEAEYVVQTIEGLLGGISHFSVDSGRGGHGVGQTLGFSDIAVLYRTHAVGEEVQHALQRSGIPYQRAARKDLFQRADIRAVLAHMALVDPALPPVRALLEACLATGITEEQLAYGPWPALLGHARQTENLATFFHSLNFERDIDLYDPRASRVALMTVHAAKGLEWEAVFLIGCEEGRFPHPAAPEDEERRLFYVGMTRARLHLYLSYAQTRMVQGERRTMRPSPFLQDIASELLHQTFPFADRARPRHTQLALTDLFGE